MIQNSKNEFVWDESSDSLRTLCDLPTEFVIRVILSAESDTGTYATHW